MVTGNKNFYEKGVDFYGEMVYNRNIVNSLGCRQVGKAQDFDSCIPWFESRHPSHKNSHSTVGLGVSVLERLLKNRFS